MSAHSHLDSCNSEDLATLLTASDLPRQSLHFFEGQLIFAEGFPCKGVFVVRSGLIELSLRCTRVDAVRVRIAGPEQIIGLVSAMSRVPYSKSAVAVEDAVLDQFVAEDVRCFLYQRPDRYMKALNFLCEDADLMQRLLAVVKTTGHRTVRCT